MAKVKGKFKNLILLILLLVVWVIVGLLGKVISNKTTASFTKEAQGYCCPCAPPEGCECSEGTTPEAIDIDAAECASCCAA